MPKNTNIPIATQIISNTSTNTVTFINIPQTYSHLIVKVKAKTIGLPAIMLGRINNASSLYSHTAVGGNGSSPGSTRSSNIADMYFSSYAHISNTWSRYQYNFMNYSNSTVNKTILARGSNPGYGIDAAVALWRDNSPVTSITIYLDRAEYWEPGSSFTIYGVSNSSIQAKATGGTIYQDDLYSYHIFSSSGTFTPNQNLSSADYLIVGGGGGGGNGNPQATGGGGGFVGYATSSFNVGANYPVTVGAGGGSVTSGSSSSFNSLSMSGGGGGASGYYPDRGGSSGSNINGVVTNYLGGQTTSGVNNSQLAGGGGAGAASAGMNSSPFNPSIEGSIGGIGYASSITGSLVYYGGGGNGGNEGTGSNGGWGAYVGHVPTRKALGGGGWGGGQITSNPAAKPTPGDMSSGGGGGGGTWDNSNPKVAGADFGANGGSGIVIVRYLK